MSRDVTRRARGAKSGRFPSGNQNFPGGNPISPIMLAIKEKLPAHKAARALAYETEQPLSICQKLLSGHRVPNADMLLALLVSDLGWTMIEAAMERARQDGKPFPAWYMKRTKERSLIQGEAQLKRLEQQLKQDRQYYIDNGGGE